MAGDLAGDLSGGAGGDPVVDDDRHPAVQVEPLPTTPEPRDPAVELLPLPRTRRPAIPPAEILVCVTTRRSTTLKPPSPMAPMASSGWKGTPSLRTTITSSGASRASATSRARGTPPRGSPRTTTSCPRSCSSRSASNRPASARFWKPLTVLAPTLLQSAPPSQRPARVPDHGPWSLPGVRCGPDRHPPAAYTGQHWGFRVCRPAPATSPSALTSACRTVDPGRNPTGGCDTPGLQDP